VGSIGDGSVPSRNIHSRALPGVRLLTFVIGLGVVLAPTFAGCIQNANIATIKKNGRDDRRIDLINAAQAEIEISGLDPKAKRAVNAAFSRVAEAQSDAKQSEFIISVLAQELALLALESSAFSNLVLRISKRLQENSLDWDKVAKEDPILRHAVKQLQAAGVPDAVIVEEALKVMSAAPEVSSEEAERLLNRGGFGSIASGVKERVVAQVIESQSLRDNKSPTGIVLSANSVPEGVAQGTGIATLSAIDADPDEIFIFELVAGDGDADNGQFALLGNSLNTNAVPDFETKSALNVRLRVTDRAGKGTSFEAPFVISVIDTNEEPQPSGSSIPVALAVTSGQPLIMNLPGAMDPDQGQSLAFEIAGPYHGTLTMVPTPNSDSAVTTYTPELAFIGQDVLTVRVCDSGSPRLCTSEQRISIDVRPRPSVSITTPNPAGGDVVTDASDLVISGSCNASVRRLTFTAGHSADFNDACVASGTWSANVTMTWKHSHITVQATSFDGATEQVTLGLRRTIIVGQDDYDSENLPTRLGGPTGTGASMWAGSAGVAIPDVLRHRVLIYNSFPTDPMAPPDAILGQDGLNSNSSGCLANRLNSPAGVHYDGTRFWVADRGNNRVLGWNGWPTYHGQPADIVLGQSNMTSCLANRGTTLTAASLSVPNDVWADSSRVAVADRDNNRVLLWANDGNLVTGAAASWVLGQADFITGTSNSGGRTAQSLASPNCVLGDGPRLVICDTSNHRVLVWDSPIDANRKPADAVIGSSNMTTMPRDLLLSTREPFDALVVGNRLYVADGISSVRYFDDYRNRTYAAGPSGILGQTDQSHFGRRNCGLLTPSAGCMRDPKGLAFANNRLFVLDQGNARVLVFTEDAIAATGAVPSGIIGAPSTAHGTYFYGYSANLSSGEMSIARSGNKLIFGQSSPGRILIHNTLPDDPSDAPDLVLGQPTLVDTFHRSSVNNGMLVNDVDTDGTVVVAADIGYHRILVWTGWPTINDQAPNKVLGQTDFVAGGAAVTQSRLNTPRGLALFGDRLAVADSSNNRVLIWNSLSAAANGAAADIVLGQPNFTIRNPGTTAGLMRDPRDVELTATSLIVSDAGNNRILIWRWAVGQEATLVSGSSANVVLGQGDFDSGSANRGGAVSLASLNAPSRLDAANGRLYIADRQNNRVLVWRDLESVTIGQPADFVLGQLSGSHAVQGNSLLRFVQSVAATSDGLVAAASDRTLVRWNPLPDATAASPQHVVTSPEILRSSAGLTARTLGTSHVSFLTVAGKVLLSDRYNYRILVHDTPPQRNNATPQRVWGQPGFATNFFLDPVDRAVFSYGQPNDIKYARGRFFVADPESSRVLIWNGLPADHSDQPDVILGQPDASLRLINSGSGRQIVNATSVEVIGKRLFVSDWIRHRVLVWNDVDNVQTFQQADFVLGQNSFNEIEPNQGLPEMTATSMKNPSHFCSNGRDLALVDGANQRVLIWKNAGTRDLSGPPDLALGASGLSGPLAAAQAPSRYLQFPNACAWASDDELWVTEGAFHRAIGWRQASTLTGDAPADLLWGQPDFETGTFAGVQSHSHIRSPSRIWIVGPEDPALEGLMMISGPASEDIGQTRVLMVPRPR
jgi:hypothetical protein